jgi:thiaminase/transcriptional activator TenA
MRNGRSLIAHESLIKRHNLATTTPVPESLFWTMWLANSGSARQALESAFVQGIKKGTLDPIRYGAFNVSDIYYCSKAADDYKLAAQRAVDPILKDYLLQKHKSYVHYNQTVCSAWSLSGPESIIPTQTALKYSQFEISVAKGTAENGNTCDPIYSLIVMIPCEYLWAWLAAQLAPPDASNVYASWITVNNSPDGAYAMGNFLQNYSSNHRVDQEVALSLYRTAMTYECNNFLTATGSS